MITSFNNKNPLINFERNHLKHQKPQKITRSENVPKMHENMHEK